MSRRFSRRSILRAGAILAVGAALGPLGSRMPAHSRETDELVLARGRNVRSWCGPDMPIADATAEIPLLIAHRWDVEARSWSSYVPSIGVDQIGTLRHGDPLVMQLRGEARWRQPRYDGAYPESLELPFGWSLVGWSGLREAVWAAFGKDTFGAVKEVRRWNTDYQRWISYVPGQSAEQLFAVLHPGDAIWVNMRVAGQRYNPADGMSDAQLHSGEITYYHPSLAFKDPMYCPPWNQYDPADPQIAAAVTWPCGTRLRIWRDDRYVDVIVQDTGELGRNHVDLSEAAFNQLALPAEGRVDVLIEVLAGPE